eukprot:scaffold9721_cov45-Phaeocystis_antarctica.AAC.1
MGVRRSLLITTRGTFVSWRQCRPARGIFGTSVRARKCRTRRARFAHGSLSARRCAFLWSGFGAGHVPRAQRPAVDQEEGQGEQLGQQHGARLSRQGRQG